MYAIRSYYAPGLQARVREVVREKRPGVRRNPGEPGEDNRKDPENRAARHFTTPFPALHKLVLPLFLLCYALPGSYGHPRNNFV